MTSARMIDAAGSFSLANIGSLGLRRALWMQGRRPGPVMDQTGCWLAGAGFGFVGPPKLHAILRGDNENRNCLVWR